MPFPISPFHINSYAGVLALWQQCEGVGLSDADSRESIALYLDRNPGTSFIAHDDGRVIGAVLGGHDGRRGYIHHLAVHPACRRQGLGSLLMAKCLDALQRAGIHKCHLFIFNSNSSGIAFWTAEGWTLRKDVSLMSKEIVSLP